MNHPSSAPRTRLAIGDRVVSAPEYRGAPAGTHPGTVVAHNTDRTVVVVWDNGSGKRRTILEDRLIRIEPDADTREKGGQS